MKNSLNQYPAVSEVNENYITDDVKGNLPIMYEDYSSILHLWRVIL